MSMPPCQTSHKIFILTIPTSPSAAHLPAPGLLTSVLRNSMFKVSTRQKKKKKKEETHEFHLSCCSTTKALQPPSLCHCSFYQLILNPGAIAMISSKCLPGLLMLKGTLCLLPRLLQYLHLSFLLLALCVHVSVGDSCPVVDGMCPTRSSVRRFFPCVHPCPLCTGVAGCGFFTALAPACVRFYSTASAHI